MSRRLATLSSNILNPFLVSFVIIILLAFEATSSTSDSVRWALISIALSVLPVFIVIVYQVWRKKLDSIFVNRREQRSGIYLLASALAVVDCIILFYLEAPELLRVTFIAGLTAILIFTVINFFWKISLHTAFVAASVTILIIVYGAAGVWSVVLLPLVAWARIEMNQHSLAQVVTGTMLAAVIVVVVFQGFGMIGS